MNEINLLPPKKRISTEDSKSIRTLRLLSLGSLLLVASLSIGTFFMTAFSSLPKLQEDEKRASAELDSLREKTTKYLIAQNRLKEIQSYLSTRLDYAKVLEDMEDTSIQEMSFDTVDLQDKQVTLTVSSTSLLAINTLINSLKDKSESAKLYKRLTLSKWEHNGSDVGKGHVVLLQVTLP